MENDWRCRQSTHNFNIYLWLSGADRTHEQNARVASSTAGIETGQRLVIKRCLCPIAFCNYNCLNIGLYRSSAVFYSFICHKSPTFMQADCGQSLHKSLSFPWGDVTWDKITWLRAHLTVLYYKRAKCSVISTDWSHLWYSASSFYVLRKCVILKCVIWLTVTGLTVDITKEYD